jgi:predicted phage tail protein
VQRTSDGTTWSDVGTDLSPLTGDNIHQSRTLTDTSSSPTAGYLYRIVAQNTVGYGAEFPSMTVTSTSDTLAVNKPAAPTNLTATLQSGPRVSLTWRDNATNESGFVVERSTNGAGFVQIATPPARTNTGNVTMVDNSVTVGNTYEYRVVAVNVAGRSDPSNTVSVPVLLPGQPVISAGTAAASGANERVTLTWGDVSNETSYVVQWSTSSTFATVSGQSSALPANSTTYTTGNIARQTWYFRVRAANVVATVDSAPFTVPPAP